MKETTDRYYNIFSTRFWLGELDLRPLGFMRVAFGAVLFWSISDIAPILFDFFSDQGVAPRWALLEKLVRSNRFCIFDLAGPLWVVAALYVLTLIAIAFFTVGWHSRIASVVTFVMVCGIHERNLLLFDGSDNVLRVLLFWLMFMPTGARYSIDAVLRAARGLPTVTHAPALPMRLGQLNIAWIYLNTVIYKWPGVEWHNGTALRIALGLDHLFTRSLGHLMYDQRWFIWLGTHGTVVVETGFLPLFFLPFTRPLEGRLSKWPKWLFQPTYKALAIAGGTSLHLGIATLMSVGNFSYIMISAYFLLYEAEWIAWIVAGLNQDRFWGKGRTRVLYDGDCPRCGHLAKVLHGFDPYDRLELVDFRQATALPEGATPETLAEQLHVVSDDGKLITGWQAFRRLGRRTPLLAPLTALTALPGLEGLGGLLYRTLWAHAPRSNPKPVTLPRRVLPENVRALARGTLQAGLSILMVFTLWFSFPDIAKIPAVVIGGKPYTGEVDVSPSKMWHPMFEFIQEVELWQKWDMFSPKPLDHDVYIMGRGELGDGTKVDVLRGDRGNAGPVLPPIYPSFFFTRWTKYINNIVYEGDNSPWSLEFGRYICRQWNNNPPPGRGQLKTFQLFREEHRVALFDEKEPDDWHEVKIWDHHCF